MPLSKGRGQVGELPLVPSSTPWGVSASPVSAETSSRNAAPPEHQQSTAWRLHRAHQLVCEPGKPTPPSMVYPPPVQTLHCLRMRAHG